MASSYMWGTQRHMEDMVCVCVCVCWAVLGQVPAVNAVRLVVGGRLLPGFRVVRFQAGGRGGFGGQVARARRAA